VRFRPSVFFSARISFFSLPPENPHIPLSSAFLYSEKDTTPPFFPQGKTIFPVSALPPLCTYFRFSFSLFETTVEFLPVLSFFSRPTGQHPLLRFCVFPNTPPLFFKLFPFSIFFPPPLGVLGLAPPLFPRVLFFPPCRSTL